MVGSLFQLRKGGLLELHVNVIVLKGVPPAAAFGLHDEKGLVGEHGDVIGGKGTTTQFYPCRGGHESCNVRVKFTVFNSDAAWAGYVQPDICADKPAVFDEVRWLGAQKIMRDWVRFKDTGSPSDLVVVQKGRASLKRAVFHPAIVLLVRQVDRGSLKVLQPKRPMNMDGVVPDSNPLCILKADLLRHVGLPQGSPKKPKSGAFLMP